METKKVVYISGPISGIADDNRPAFYKAQKALEAIGLKVINVFELRQTPGQTWLDYILFDIQYLVQCDFVYLLKGWEKSYGSIIEVLIAFKLDKVIAFEEPRKSNRATLNMVFKNKKDTSTEDDFELGNWFEHNIKGD